jgi:hypothetical protein
LLLFVNSCKIFLAVSHIHCRNSQVRMKKHCLENSIS